nr:xylulose kinase-1 [Tanacetum cinerariifolium]
MNIWKVIQNGNRLKRTRRDHHGRVIILPPTTAEEHLAVHKESKARTTLLQSILDDHVADFHYMDDARDIWNAVKARMQVMLENLLSWVSLLSVSTSEVEAEIESNVETPIQEPIIVQDLPSFSCNSSDKIENTSRTSSNKNGYFNKKAGHFRKSASSFSKLCFLCGSGTHLIKDCDFYKKQMANKTVGIRVGPAVRPQPVPTGKLKVKPVPTGKPQVFTPIPTGRPNRPFPVPTDRGYSPSLLLSPQQVFLGNLIEKVFTWYPRTMMDLIHLHTDDNVADLLTKSFDGPRVIIPTGRYIVPTGRVIVTTGRVIFRIMLHDREMITSQLLYLRGSSYETLFVLSSSNRGRLLRFLI